MRGWGLALAALAVLAGGCRRAPDRPNLVLVTIDTLRADHTTPYGYRHDTTPVLARLAREVVGVEHAVPVPSDHAGDGQRAALGQHAVGIALGTGPAFGQDGLVCFGAHPRTSFSISRAMINCCTSVAPS